MTPATYFPPEMEADVRRQVRAGFAAAVPAEHVDIVTDLVMHATREAMCAIERVCKSTGDARHYIATIGPAFALVRGLCTNAEEGLRGFASTAGLPVNEVRVRSGQ